MSVLFIYIFILGWICYLITICCAFQNTLSFHTESVSVWPREGCSSQRIKSASQNTWDAELRKQRQAAERVNDAPALLHFFFCQYQLLGMFFLTPKSRSWCRDCTAWATTRAAENLLLGCLFYFPPTHWLKCCSLVISQAQVYRQLTSHSHRLGEKNIRKRMSGAWGCFCFSFQLN